MAATAPTLPRKSLIQRLLNPGLTWSEYIWAYIFVLPWLIGFLSFIAGPMLVSLYLSFTKYDLVMAPWVGLANWERLFQDGLMRKSLWNTGYYVLIGVPLNTIEALWAAILLTRPIRGQNFFRTALYIPSVVPGVANIILWLWLLNPDFGLVNSILSSFGIEGPLWFQSVTWSKPSFILITLFSVGTQMVIFVAGIKNIPQSLYEAAEIDGAGRWGSFRHITVPMLSPVIFFNLVVSMIGAFQVFTSAFIATDGRGGPVESTLFYVLYLYKNAWLYFKMGYASTLAWLLFLIVVAMTGIQFWIARRWVHYEA
ncbi:MAG: sugar ABC transporter permease [Chloroflexota bacterium]